jgi:hypothetical protein
MKPTVKSPEVLDYDDIKFKLRWKARGKTAEPPSSTDES